MRKEKYVSSNVPNENGFIQGDAHHHCHSLLLYNKPLESYRNLVTEYEWMTSSYKASTKKCGLLNACTGISRKHNKNSVHENRISSGHGVK